MHQMYTEQYANRNWINAAQILLEIGNNAKCIDERSKGYAPTVSGKVRAEYWADLMCKLSRNNQPLEALGVARQWAKDRDAA